MKKSEFWSRYKYLVFFIIIFSISGVSIFKYVLTPAELVSEDIQYKKKYHKISNFEMTNQNNELVTEKNYNNRIYIADFFFTTCPSICPIMTGNMVFLQNELEGEDIMFASFSVTPEIDSVEVLKKYAGSHDMIHTENFVLVDKEKRIRGYYDGTLIEEMNRLLEDIEILQKSYIEP